MCCRSLKPREYCVFCSSGVIPYGGCVGLTLNPFIDPESSTSSRTSYDRMDFVVYCSIPSSCLIGPRRICIATSTSELCTTDKYFNPLSRVSYFKSLQSAIPSSFRLSPSTWSYRSFNVIWSLGGSWSVRTYIDCPLFASPTDGLTPSRSSFWGATSLPGFYVEGFWGLSYVSAKVELP